MNRKQLVEIEMLRAGVKVLKVKDFNAEGMKVEVGTVADVLKAEEVAKAVEAKWGLPVLVAF